MSLSVYLVCLADDTSWVDSRQDVLEFYLVVARLVPVLLVTFLLSSRSTYINLVRYECRVILSNCILGSADLLYRRLYGVAS